MSRRIRRKVAGNNRHGAWYRGLNTLFAAYFRITAIETNQKCHKSQCRWLYPVQKVEADPANMLSFQ